MNDQETTYEIHANAPKYNFIKNWTNILTPETSDGPYFYPQSQTLRQDIREGQPGVPLSLEIGVVDINTCEPMEDVLVDIWVSRIWCIPGSNEVLWSAYSLLIALQCHWVIQLFHWAFSKHAFQGTIRQCVERWLFEYHGRPSGSFCMWYCH